MSDPLTKIFPKNLFFAASRPVKLPRHLRMRRLDMPQPRRAGWTLRKAGWREPCDVDFVESFQAPNEGPLTDCEVEALLKSVEHVEA